MNNRRAFFRGIMATLAAAVASVKSLRAGSPPEVLIDPWTESIVGQDLLNRGVSVTHAMNTKRWRAANREQLGAINATRKRFGLAPLFSKKASDVVLHVLGERFYFLP
jgi:hypothetical protein